MNLEVVRSLYSTICYKIIQFGALCVVKNGHLSQKTAGPLRELGEKALPKRTAGPKELRARKNCGSNGAAAKIQKNCGGPNPKELRGAYQKFKWLSVAYGHMLISFYEFGISKMIVFDNML